GERSFLLDIRGSASARAAPRLYDYLKEQARQKGKMEATRLFYVGCTRAAERLWLGASLPWDEQKEQAKGPRAGSLLATIWTDVEGRVPVERTPDAAVTATSSSSIGGYLRLQQLPEIEHVPAPSAAQGTADPDNHLARALGTAIHRGLESLVYRAELPQQCDQPLRLLLSVALTDAGCDSAALDNYASQAAEAVDRVLQDDWARWMLSPSRQSRTAEYPLTLAGSDEIRELVLDYVFLDEARGERWLIDYKTAAPRRDESPDAFMAAQLTLYQPQLQRYRQALQARFAEPVRCALYFTALGRHCEWQAESP
ncbi:MAG: ATP-dependent helicase/nuclease subunit A, partial [Halieaceae bacterium]